MILASNQSKQRAERGPLHVYLENQEVAIDRVSRWNMCHFSWSSQVLELVLVAISLPDNMQLHELIFTQIVKPGLNAWLKGSYALSALNSVRNFSSSGRARLRQTLKKY